MKKLVLMLLTLGCIAETQAQLVHSARDVIVSVLINAKAVVTAHPYLAATVGCVTAASCWYYFKKPSEEEDPSYENFKKYWETKPVSPKVSPTVSPTDSPSQSADTLTDFTGDFPNPHPQSRTLHPSKLRHN